MEHPDFTEARKRLAPDLSNAVEALLRRLVDGDVKEVLATTDLFAGATFSDALTKVGSLTDDTDVMQAATALRWAIQHTAQGDVEQARAWLTRVHESLSDNPLLAMAGMTPEDLNPVQLAWVDDEDGVHSGSVKALADHIKNAGLTGSMQMTRVYAATAGALVDCPWRTDTSGFDPETDMATCSIIVSLPDGRQVTGLWSADGRN